MRNAPNDDIRAAIEGGFRALIAQKPYRSITVSDVCERAHISRKTFYVYFANKEEIVAAIFRRDVVKPLEDFNALFAHHEVQEMGSLIYVKMYQALYDNRIFYEQLVRPLRGRDDTFIRVVTNVIYDYNLTLMSGLGFSVGSREEDYVAYFFASSQAMLMQKWICDGMEMPVAELADLYMRMCAPFWTGAAAKRDRHLPPSR